MKYIYTICLILVIWILTVSCNSDSSDLELQANEIAIPEYQLSITDSFGVEFGDSITMIGSIDDFCIHPNGSIIILDQAALRIRVFSDDGEGYLIGRQGEGPGEFLLPHAVCALQDGRILVSDEMNKEVQSYDITGNYLGNYFTSERYVPYKMFSVDSSSIVGSMMDLEMGDEEILLSYYYGRFNSDNHPSIVYSNRQWIWPDPEIYTDIDLSEFSASPDGKVFIAQDNTDYSIVAYSPAGEELYVIECTDVNRIPKTPIEIQEEIEEFEAWAVQDDAYTGGYEPIPYKQLISLIGVDHEGNLWVQRFDSENNFNFDVWNSAGQILYTAILIQEDSETEMLFRVDQYGILGAVNDPEQYPQVYLLGLENR